MWQVECMLVSCMFQQWQYVYVCQLVVVLRVMNSVDVLLIMHMFVHPPLLPPKLVLDSSRMTALYTDSFDIPSKTQRFRDSRKVVALFEAVPEDCRSRVLLRTRIRPDLARFDV